MSDSTSAIAESYQARAGTWIAQAGPGLRPLRGGTLTKT